MLKKISAKLNSLRGKYSPEVLMSAGLLSVIFMIALFNNIGSSRKDLSKEPSFVIKREFLAKNISLYGVKCGDPKSKIDSSRIDYGETYDEGIVGLENPEDAAYRIADGKVISFTLKEDLAKGTGLTSFNIHSFLGRGIETSYDPLDMQKIEYPEKGLLIIMSADKPVAVGIDCK